MKSITSASNPWFRNLLRLTESARARREQQRTLIDGAHLVEAYDLVHGGFGMELVVKHSAQSHPEVLRVRAGREAMVLADGLFDKLAGVVTPVGILASIPLAAVAEPPRVDCALLLDGVQDPGNLGSILRTALAAGVDVAYLSEACADAWSPRCLRGGMGAQFTLPLRQRADLPALAPGFAGRLFRLEPAAAQTPYALDLTGSCGFVVGAEGAGVSELLRRQSIQALTIPMAPGVESLNVAAATAVVLFERRRQLLAADRLRPPELGVPSP